MPIRQFRSVEEMTPPGEARPFAPENLRIAIELSRTCHRAEPSQATSRRPQASLDRRSKRGAATAGGAPLTADARAQAQQVVSACSDGQGARSTR